VWSYRYLLLYAVVLFTTACSTATTKVSSTSLNNTPPWLSNPYCDSDKYAAVGCSASHIKGEAAQKKLAISRAIDDLATQVKVKVDSVTIRKKHTNKMEHTSKSETVSLQKVSNVEISTKIKAIYKKKNGDICVWAILK